MIINDVRCSDVIINDEDDDDNDNNNANDDDNNNDDDDDDDDDDSNQFKIDKILIEHHLDIDLLIFMILYVNPCW